MGNRILTMFRNIGLGIFGVIESAFSKPGRAAFSSAVLGLLFFGEAILGAFVSLINNFIDLMQVFFAVNAEPLIQITIIIGVLIFLWRKAFPRKKSK